MLPVGGVICNCPLTVVKLTKPLLKAANSTRPWAAATLPPSKTISPPTKAKVSPVLTAKGLSTKISGGINGGRLGGTGKSIISKVSGSSTKLFPNPSTVICPGFVPICKPKGAVMVRRVPLPLGFLALNLPPPTNSILSAVLATNEPPISRPALGPMVMPLGLIKNKFAAPLA